MAPRRPLLQFRLRLFEEQLLSDFRTSEDRIYCCYRGFNYVGRCHCLFSSCFAQSSRIKRCAPEETPETAPFCQVSIIINGQAYLSAGTMLVCLKNPYNVGRCQAPSVQPAATQFVPRIRVPSISKARNSSSKVECQLLIIDVNARSLQA